MFDWKNKKIMVTGGAGFIGSTLVKRLVKGGANVRVIDNLWRGNRDNLMGEDGNYVIDMQNNFHEADLTDNAVCEEFIRDVELVYHLADIVGGVQFVFSNEAFVFRQNLLINTNVLAACLVNEIPDYIYVGTACSYPKHLQMAEGVAQLREDQTYPAEPESSYGWSKLMGEYEAELAQRSGKINVGLLRFHNVYGPGSVFEGSIAQALPSLIRKAVNHPTEPFIVWGSGTQYRDFVYIDDIINALVSVAGKGMNKGLIQIGSEKAVTLKEAAETVIKISDKQIELKFDLSKPEGDRGRIGICDRAREILGWEQTVDFESGLRNTYQWIEQQMKKNAVTQ